MPRPTKANDHGHRPAARGGWLRRLYPRRIARSRDGAAAVEFALVSIPFTALLMATLETALQFFAAQTFETAIAAAGRLIRTGQAQEQGLDAAQFREQVCDLMGQAFDCEGKLKIDVRTYESFADIDFSQPVDEDGNLIEDFTYDPGDGGDIVVVRAFYEWPVYVNLLGSASGTLANGKRLLAAGTAFRNEPF